MRLLFLLQIVQVPRNSFTGNPVFFIMSNISTNICDSGIMFSTNKISLIFKFIEGALLIVAHLLGAKN